MKNRWLVLLRGQCSRHCCHVSGRSPLLVGRQKRFVSGFWSVKFFQHVGWIFKLPSNFKIFQFFFFLTFLRFSKLLFDVLNPRSPAPPSPTKFRNYVAKAYFKRHMITCPKREPQVSRTSQCNIKTQWLSIAFWNSVTSFLFCFLLLCHWVTRSC